MTPENFCYWLQGFFEFKTDGELTGNEVMIREHLQLVMKKETLDLRPPVSPSIKPGFIPYNPLENVAWPYNPTPSLIC